MDSTEVAIVILAGGEGSRLGGGKPLRQFAGERLIDRALRQAAGWSDLVAIAARNPSQVEPVNAAVIVDAPEIDGPLGGLAAALRFATEVGREYVLTIPADTPFLPDDLLDCLLSKIGECGCALASSGGRVHPVCGLWRISALARIDDYLAGYRRSLNGFAALIGFQKVEWAAEPHDPFFNINTSDELARAERRSRDQSSST
jgi:molybdopterin-guanine dinucleotide biosynthesis protein A